MKSIYYSPVYPYITNRIVACGRAFKNPLRKVKQNRIIIIVFSAMPCVPNTTTTLPLINFLDKLTVENIFKLNSLIHKFVYRWQTKQLLSIFDHHFEFAKNKHSYNTGYAVIENLDVLFLDFAKAFDSVPHHWLLRKADFYGIRGKLHQWLKDFLTTCQQCVVVNGQELEDAHKEMKYLLYQP